MAIDHHTGVELINTEAVHIWYLQKHTFTHIACLCSHLLHHFQLWPLKRTAAPERLWWICQKQGVCVSKQHLYAHLTILHPVAELFYSLSLIYFSALCNPHAPNVLVHWYRSVYRENNTCTDTQTAENSQADVLILQFLSHSSRDLSPRLCESGWEGSERDQSIRLVWQGWGWHLNPLRQGERWRPQTGRRRIKGCKGKMFLKIRGIHLKSQRCLTPHFIKALILKLINILNSIHCTFSQNRKFF